jgi:hypothetical protein
MSLYTINSAATKALALEIAKQSTGPNLRKKARVGKEFLEQVSAKFVQVIHDRVNHHDNRSSSRRTLR